MNTEIVVTEVEANISQEQSRVAGAVCHLDLQRQKLYKAEAIGQQLQQDASAIAKELNGQLFLLETDRVVTLLTRRTAIELQLNSFTAERALLKYQVREAEGELADALRKLEEAERAAAAQACSAAQ